MVIRIEAAIQRELVRWIKNTYPEARVHASLNENSRHNTDMGIWVGFPDLTLFHNNHELYLELKKKKGKLSGAQIKCHAELKEMGKTVVTAYGYIEAQEKISAFFL
jgi:hypothetical protein